MRMLNIGHWEQGSPHLLKKFFVNKKKLTEQELKKNVG